jgi:DNA invertase Pin-like site-specific DNA recombinase
LPAGIRSSYLKDKDFLHGQRPPGSIRGLLPGLHPTTGASGLGLEAQQRAVRDHLNGGSWTLLSELTEIESGKCADRPKLKEALQLCRVHGAKLLIAKLDRLARNVAFISNLMKSDVEFEAVDFPQANRLTIHILAAVAEHEAEAISNRTASYRPVRWMAIFTGVAAEAF